MNEVFQKLYLHISEIKAVLAIAEQQSRRKNNDALDVDDDRLSLKMQTEAFTEIKRIRKLNDCIEDFKKELNAFSEECIKTVHPITEVRDDINNGNPDIHQINEDNDESVFITTINNGDINKDDNKKDINFVNDDLVENQNADIRTDVLIRFLHKEHSVSSIKDVLPKITSLLMFRKPYEISQLPWDEFLLIDGKQVFSYEKKNLLSDDYIILSNKLVVACIDDKDIILSLTKTLLTRLGYEEDAGLMFI